MQGNMMKRSKEHYQKMKELYEAEGQLNYMLDVFGDTIAQREGYKDRVGIEAIQFYIKNKYHWLPSQVKSMSLEDLRFLLTEELANWTLPKIAKP